MDELYLFLEEEEGVTVVEIILVLLVPAHQSCEQHSGQSDHECR